MPIKIPFDLPARKILEEEGVLLIKDTDAIRQDIRPLKIALLNLMPQKIKTETQIARLLGGSPLQIEMTLVAPSEYVPKNTPREHMLDFYHSFTQIKKNKYDGMIITGAPVERLDFKEVLYWDELRKIFDWAETNVFCLFNLCWGAQAALNHFYGIPKYNLTEKCFGVFDHVVLNHTSLLTRGLNDKINVPVSRFTENRKNDFLEYNNLNILIDSKVSGLCLIHDTKLRHVHMFNHLEYDSNTLEDEYKRDLEKGHKIKPPKNYFPNNDPQCEPINTWRVNAHLLFGNWLNYIYQSTPFNLNKVGEPIAK